MNEDNVLLLFHDFPPQSPTLHPAEGLDHYA